MRSYKSTEKMGCHPMKTSGMQTLLHAKRNLQLLIQNCVELHANELDCSIKSTLMQFEKEMATIFCNAGSTCY